MPKSDQERAVLIDAVDGMIEAHGDSLVSALFRFYGPEPEAVAFALSSTKYLGGFESLAEASRAYLSDEELGLPAHLIQFFDRAAYGRTLIDRYDGPFDCVEVDSQYHLFDKATQAKGAEIDQALEMYRSGGDNPGEEHINTCDHRAQFVVDIDKFRAMSYEDIATWAEDHGFGEPHSFSALKSEIADYAGINTLALRGTDWLTQDHLLEWNDSDVRGILYDHYGPLADIATAMLNEQDVEKRIYFMATEGVADLYESESAHLKGQAGNKLSASALTVSYPQMFPALGLDDPVYPVAVIDKEKLNNATHEDCANAAEKVLAKIRSKERSKGNAR